jgi:hypothetical protein
VPAGHFSAAALRIQATPGPILVLQNTTELAFKPASPRNNGLTGTATGPENRGEGRKTYRVCGMPTHAGSAITPDGLPPGLTATKFRSRDKFKATTALRRKINPTRVATGQKESMRRLDNLRRSPELPRTPKQYVHIGDHKSDIHGLCWLAQKPGTDFPGPSSVDRLAEDRKTTIAKTVADVQSSGVHEIIFRDAGAGNPAPRLPSGLLR